MALQTYYPAHYITLMLRDDTMIRTLFQSTVGTSENGVMTSELLEWLFSGKTGEDAKTKVSLASSPCQCDTIY